ncbi:MAG: hypothetical protein PHY43_14310 [Verrucomicrobiales bacterium]|nr:hypothetical protein [Verrucomicrobiales bacterium]
MHASQPDELTKSGAMDGGNDGEPGFAVRLRGNCPVSVTAGLLPHGQTHKNAAEPAYWVFNGDLVRAQAKHAVGIKLAGIADGMLIKLAP